MSKNNKKDDYKVQALKNFTKISADTIRDALKSIDVDSLIHYVFIKKDDEQIYKMIKMYEKQLILCKLDFPKFKSGLHNFYNSTYKYIRNNGLFKKFFELVYTINVEISKKQVNGKVLVGYMDLLVQQYAYFKGSEMVVIGVGNKGLMAIPEIGKNLTRINYEVKQLGDVAKTMKKYGYDKATDIMDFQRLITYDQVLTNLCFNMAYFITEENKGVLFSEPFRDPNTLISSNNNSFLPSSDIDYIKERLTHRQYLLPTKGVIAKYENCGEIKEVFMIEQFSNDTTILLFNITFTNETKSMGYYDVLNKVYYDCWRSSSYEKINSFFLESFILQTYMNISCKLEDVERKRYICFNRNDLNKFMEDEFYIPAKVIYEFKENKNEEHEHGTRTFNRNDYATVLKNVDSFLRRLPVGASASEEAVGLAERLGIELPNGYTFVRGFNKTVHKKK